MQRDEIRQDLHELLSLVIENDEKKIESVDDDLSKESNDAFEEENEKSQDLKMEAEDFSQQKSMDEDLVLKENGEEEKAENEEKLPQGYF